MQYITGCKTAPDATEHKKQDSPRCKMALGARQNML